MPPLVFNGYLIFILAILVIDYILDLIVDILNLKRLSPKLPEEFEGYYDSEKYAQSQEYTRVHTKFGFVTGTFDFLLIICFILFGGFNWIDQIARGFGFNEIGTGLIFTGILMVGSQILSLPFSIYGTFVIEERFGFNKTTPATFTLDLFKGLGLTILIGAPILALILWLFQQLGSSAWLYAWAAVTVFSLLMSYIAPVWIMPLFNKFTPLEDGELKETIEEYAKKQNFKMQGIFKIDGSRRSTKSNAFFTGFGKSRRIALYDTLIENHTVRELVGVLAHEIGHNKKGHVIKGIVISILTSGLMFFIMSLFLNNPKLFAAFRMENISIYASLAFFGFLYSPVSMLIGIFSGILSRKHEYEADHFAVTTTGDKQGMIKALKKLSVDNLSNLTPHPLKVFLEYSHPPVLERIKAIRRIN